MKKRRLIRPAALLVAIALVLPALAESQRYALAVKGLACPFCAYGIEKHLHRVRGVDAIQVDIAQGRVVVTMAEGSVMTREKANKAVEDAGFSLHSFQQLPTPQGGTSDEGH